MYKIPVASCVVYDPVTHKLLVQKRKTPECEYGLHTFAGGKVEENEDLFECAKRELFEETSLISKHTGDEQLIGISHDRNFLILFVLITKFEGILINREPAKIERYDWLHFHQLHGLPQTKGMLGFTATALFGKFLEMIKSGDY